MKAHILLSIALTLSTMGCASNAASLQEGAAASAVGGESTTGDAPIPASCPDIEVAHANGTLEVQIEAFGVHSILPGGATRRPVEAHQYSIAGSTFGTIEVLFDGQPSYGPVDDSFMEGVVDGMERSPDVAEVRPVRITRQWQGQELEGLEVAFLIRGQAMTSLVLLLPVGTGALSMSVNGPRERKEEIESIFASLIENTTTECLPAP